MVWKMLFLAMNDNLIIIKLKSTKCTSLYFEVEKCDISCHVLYNVVHINFVRENASRYKIAHSFLISVKGYAQD